MAVLKTPEERAKETNKRLKKEYPGTTQDLCELDFTNPFELLTATILSAQTTDVRVNMTTPALFQKYPDAPSLAAANPSDVEEMVKSTGFYRNKTKSIMGMAQAVTDNFGGELPEDIEDLITLPGVGRKTANVLLSVAMDKPGMPVDTHVTRLSNLLGLTTGKDAVKIETALTAMIPAKDWGAFSLRLILHGRRICIARRPKCEECVLNDFCPSAFAVPAPADPKKVPAKKVPAKKATVKKTAKKAPARKA